MSKYIVIHSYYGCPCCEDDPGGTELEYYDTLQAARKGAVKGDIITQFVEEYKEYITITEDMDLSTRMLVQPALGRIQKCDIGKRVYFTNGYPQVENLEQFKKRMERCK